MIEDARSLVDGSTIEADVCVVGAGAAGIALARELDRRDLTVLVLESGGLAYEQETQALYDGELGGNVLQSESQYLASSRLRYLGGTTNHWRGWCRPLDPIDFEERPWVGHSGWPFGRAELEPFYGEARALLGLAPEDGDRRVSAAHPPGPQLAAGRWFETTGFAVQPLRFGQAFRRELEGSRRIRLLLYANAVAVRAGAGARRVEEIAVACLGGRRLRARARAYVLAAGGIENARLLLASDDVARDGLGNDRGLVGRFFMDHPHSRFITVTLDDPVLARRFGRVAPDSTWPSAASALRLSDATQRAHRLLNLALTQPEILVPPAGGDAAAVGEAAARVDGGEPSYLVLEARGEQAPNPESRVALTGERDALGVRRVRLDWRLQAQDAGSLRAAARLLGRELGARGLGRAHCGIDAPAVEALAAGEPARRLRGGPHHLGTTRMHRDPRRGVVDADCRVHGVDNLFVAGASVFPTCGCSNPTLTLLALALRLAAHLRRELRR